MASIGLHRVYDPPAKPLLAPGRMYHLQVALDRDAGQVDDGTVHRAPEKATGSAWS